MSTNMAMERLLRGPTEGDEGEPWPPCLCDDEWRLLEETIKEINTIHFWLPVCLGSLGEYLLEDDAKGIRMPSQKHPTQQHQAKQTHETWTSGFPTKTAATDSRLHCLCKRLWIQNDLIVSKYI